MIIASEAFPGNTQFLGDVAMSLVGIINARLVTEDVLTRYFLERNRDLPSKLDKLGFLDGVAETADQIFG